MGYGLPSVSDMVTKYNPVAGTVRAAGRLAHGDLVGAGRAELAGQSYGVSEAGIKGAEYAGGKALDLGEAIGDAYNQPYDAAKAANQKAGQDSERLGEKAMGMGQAGIDRALQQSNPAAKFFHNTYEGEGALAGPGAAERRYSDQLAGTDVNANYQRAEANRDIGNQFSARGLNNSGAALRAGALANAKIDADSQSRMDALAGQAQGAAETRLGGAFDRLNTMGNQRAGIVQNGTQGAIDSYTAGQLGGINGRLASANVGINQRKDTMGFLGKAGGYLAGAFS